MASMTFLFLPGLAALALIVLIAMVGGIGPMVRLFPTLVALGILLQVAALYFAFGMSTPPLPVPQPAVPEAATPEAPQPQSFTVPTPEAQAPVGV